MKCILFLVMILFSTAGFSYLPEFRFNHDVFHCGQNVKFVFELEKNAGVYQIDADSFEYDNSNFEEAAKSVAEELGKVSPIRAEFFKELANPLNTNFQYRNKIQIVRSSPASNIITPEGCNVEPLSVVVISQNVDYTVTINKSLFDLLSVESKIYYFLTLSLDLQQVFIPNLYKFELDTFDMDLLQSREFLACWFNKSCRPKTVSEFHKLAKKKIYNLKYFEQDHMITFIERGWGSEDTLFDKTTGLITEMKFPVERLTKTPSVLSSFYFFRNNKIMFQSALGSSKIKFNQEGKVSCAPIIKRINLQAINEGREIGLLDFCWAPDGKITSGHLIFGPQAQTNEKDYSTVMAGQIVTLSSVTSFSLYENEKINWVTGAVGPFKFNGQNILINGFLEVYPSGKVKCIQLGKETNFILPNGQKLNIPMLKDIFSTEMRVSAVHCFKEDGNFLGIDNTFRWNL
ncbi:MAG: hypothetical protein K2Q18_14955 [Bdellovibrionales bacterium]|nr:hypothetical protein [Bdellovibrionales bacterium]